jgi:hypothetical protein
VRGCRAVLFTAAAPHIHPFVIPSAESAAVQDQLTLTPSILFDRLANAGRLNQGNAGGIRRSTGLVRLAVRREGLFFQKEEGPMQPSSPRRSPHVIIKLLGETEPRSAGEQAPPEGWSGKGSSGQGRVKDARLLRSRSRGNFFCLFRNPPLNALAVPQKTHSDPAARRQTADRLRCYCQSIDTLADVSACAI